jgi:hypothetical protein
MASGNLPIATFASADSVNTFVAVRGAGSRPSEEEGKEEGFVENHVRLDSGYWLETNALKVPRRR